MSTSFRSWITEMGRVMSAGVRPGRTGARLLRRDTDFSRSAWTFRTAMATAPMKSRRPERRPRPRSRSCRPEGRCRRRRDPDQPVDRRRRRRPRRAQRTAESTSTPRSCEWAARCGRCSSSATRTATRFCSSRRPAATRRPPRRDGVAAALFSLPSVEFTRPRVCGSDELGEAVRRNPEHRSSCHECRERVESWMGACGRSWCMCPGDARRVRLGCGRRRRSTPIADADFSSVAGLTLNGDAAHAGTSTETRCRYRIPAGKRVGTSAARHDEVVRVARCRRARQLVPSRRRDDLRDPIAGALGAGDIGSAHGCAGLACISRRAFRVGAFLAVPRRT